jgi:molybdenum cofactor cytidylyltransferase
MFTTGLVLAAGRSRRLGQPKQVLAYRGRTLLDATLETARACGFDQILVALGGASAIVRSTVDLTGVEVVENEHFSSGCSSSLVAALPFIDERTEALVLLLGDQPEVQPRAVDSLRATCESSVASIGVCHYGDGRGHPFWFARSMFGALDGLHGDKAVWKLLESGRWPVCEVQIDGTSPLDVDTWDDYQRLLESSG